ncbi:hotdog fold thioesterase [Flavihumibacter cheonanensis]|jgi:1,4-dihydroxy-2-naphthoyl-CoA hydrolase|uniref:hotdog fold thioesterase n=1 Tax=Flavihumibacter cheonanensis TaxID=1442385 RepID=UPI001EF79C26|nr:hotdog fold thioesterase [Flavihumibacter cheonanensis]MCG7751124.1 hotdog fold thioesterase [Flavihumibacter cheonanensis]
MPVIWFKPELRLADLLPLGQGTMGEHLGIEWMELGEDFIKARMPVDHRTKQPYGLLHGGASVALAETLGSVGAALSVDPSRYIAVGMEINANHIRSVRDGFVVGTTRPVHRGSTTQVWEIRIEDERGKLVCISRLTVAIRKITG